MLGHVVLAAAACSWQGNREASADSTTLIERKPDELVRERMERTEPMEGTSILEFTFKLEGNTTVVTWARHGTNISLGKVICHFMNMDKLRGQFEQASSI